MTRTQPRTGRPPEDDGVTNRRNRRQLLALGGTATAAATVAALGLARPDSARAATGDNFILGQENSANQTTALERHGTINDWTHALEVRHREGPYAIAIVGITHGGYAIVGTDEGNGIGVHGKTPMGIGVDGGSEQGTGVHGQGWNAGVEGEAPGEDHPGVRAISRSGGPPGPLDGGLALEVIGKARFSTAGAGAVPRGRRMTTVAEPAVTAVSHITVTLTGNPGLARFDWVERQPGAGFVVHLQGVSLSEIPFTYLVIEPGT